MPAMAEEPSPRRWWLAVAGVVAGALVLRLWGTGWGLPFAYNLDERSHFLPRAVAMLRDHSLDPDYQLNPSGLIEFLAGILLVAHGGAGAAVRAFERDPGQVWLIARVASALVSAGAVWLLYVAGKRLFDRWVGLVAAAILATAFLPVHYGHLALNDAPSLAPTALGLIGIAGIVGGGRLRHYAVAGAALGLAVGLKYNAAFMGLPLLTAGILHGLGRGVEPGPRAVRAAALGLLAAGAAASVAFLALDPYALLRPGFFLDELQHLSDYTKGSLLLGETQRSGYRYYAWSLVWGLGVVPLVLAVIGGVRSIARHRVQALLLIPAPLLFFAYVGAQGRYFARYGMPVYPLLALLAGAGAVWLARLAAPRLRARGRLAAALAALGLVAVCGQGLAFTIHNDVVLSRKDTRSAAREWMVDNIPAGTLIAVEPLVPKEWYADGARLADPGSQRGYRWRRFVRTGDDARRLAKRFPGARRPADFANYGYTLFPGMLDFLRRRGVCWIVSGSGQSGRVFNDPDRVPAAARYYRALARQADLRYRVAPFAGPDAEHYFQYDLSVTFLPLRFDRPGPAMRVYRLRDCRPE